MHLKVRILLERFDRHEGTAFAKREARLCAAILSLSPALPDDGGDLVCGMTRPERGTEIDAACGIETEVPHSVCGQAAAIAALAKRIGCRGNDSEDGEKTLRVAF